MRKLLAFLCLLGSPALAAQPDLVPVKQIGLELARDIAMKAIEACRASGYNISAVVLDRAGNIQAALRDTLSAPHTLEIAERKAGASIMSGISSGEFRAARSDIRAELNHVHGLILIEGGLPIQSGGNQIGAIGVSGAPSSEEDAACATKALEAVQERLEFAS